MYACIFLCILCPLSLQLPFKLDWDCGSCGLQSVPGHPAVLQSWQEKEEEEKAEAMWSRMDDSKTNKEGRRQIWFFLLSCVHTSWADCTWPDAPIGRGRPSLSVGIHSFITMTGQCDFLVGWILAVLPSICYLVHIAFSDFNDLFHKNILKWLKLNLKMLAVYWQKTKIRRFGDLELTFYWHLTGPDVDRGNADIYLTG